MRNGARPRIRMLTRREEGEVGVVLVALGSLPAGDVVIDGLGTAEGILRVARRIVKHLEMMFLGCKMSALLSRRDKVQRKD